MEIDSDFSGSLAGIRFNTGSNAGSEPTALAVSDNSWYGNGAMVLSGRQTTTNVSNRADLVLFANGNWALQRGHGDGAAVGINQNAWELRVNGRASDNYISQIVGGVTDGESVTGYTGALYWIYYPAAPPNGTRIPIVSPSYRHSTASHWAKSGVHRLNASNALIGLGDVTGGATWRMHWIARWQ